MCSHLIVGSELTIVDQAWGRGSKRPSAKFSGTQSDRSADSQNIGQIISSILPTGFFFEIRQGSHFPCNFATFSGKSVL